MSTDERAENLREMAALGNLKAVRAYIRSGVDMNSQNKMNQWTALHWACVRGNKDVAEFLICVGADISLKNNKGQTPLDVCKSDGIRALFPGYSAVGPVDTPVSGDDAKRPPHGAPELPFVPNYIANPDLAKAWDMPEDALLGSQGESGYMRQLQHEASVSSGVPTGQQPTQAQAAQQAMSTVTASAEEREILVYNGHCEDQNLLGSVFVNPQDQTIAGLGAQILDELDGLPKSFSISRYNGKQIVPVSTKQEAFSVDRVFRGDNDAVVIVAKGEH
ncbi:hypothetical protein H4R20_002292 [Coemansia guatemalensis]|uniref:Ankyrin n=1 Tax=Coemansia guatemalensis TaxID=2761395 RepID=A0A9W8LV58_9FUNG|nr:hypothetical protein H4R20_002292 [Coemansia guatemalensis]